MYMPVRRNFRLSWRMVCSETTNRRRYWRYSGGSSSRRSTHSHARRTIRCVVSSACVRMSGQAGSLSARIHWNCSARCMLRPVEVACEADHAVIARRRRLEVEAGLPDQREVAVERAQRYAEPTPVFRDGHRFAAGEDRGEPDDADEAEADAAAFGVAKASATARRGFRRERVEPCVCPSVDNPHRVTDSVGVAAAAESLYIVCACACSYIIAFANTASKRTRSNFIARPLPS